MESLETLHVVVTQQALTIRDANEVAVLFKKGDVVLITLTIVLMSHCHRELYSVVVKNVRFRIANDHFRAQTRKRTTVLSNANGN